jgi:hypothetical protein
MAEVHATATIADVCLACQIARPPVWRSSGTRIDGLVADTQIEPYLIWGLATLSALTVLAVLFGGGIDP